MKIFFGGGLKVLWNLMNVVQIVSFTPLMTVQLPSIVSVFFKNLNFIDISIPVMTDLVRS
jgi:hypothetical protein